MLAETDVMVGANWSCSVTLWKPKIERLLSLAYDRINGNPSFVDWLNEDPQRDPNNWVAEGVYDDSWIAQSIKIDPKIVMNSMVQWLLERVVEQWKSGYDIYISKQNQINKEEDN